MRFPRTLTLAAAFAVALATPHGRADNPPKPDAPKLPTAAEVMAAKSKHAQALLDALAREDFPKLRENATALVRISQAAEFLGARKTEEYAIQARVFRGSVTALADRAKDRNLEAATLAYLDMSISCVRCHQHTRESKRD